MKGAYLNKFLDTHIVLHDTVFIVELFAFCCKLEDDQIDL